MAAVRCFEDLIAWQKARALARLIYGIARETALARDFGLRDQIQRASVSVLSNIAEGFDRSSPTEFHRFLVIAKGSCAEVRAQLYVAFDAQLIDATQFGEAKALAEETSRVISGLRRSIEAQKNKDKDRGD
ncbi:four helix bundle protein [Desulfuromonas acetoxidans]|uniref:S23 ribosomal n=1 Tax=Desulfuromonas acetoxidans (strain DSM 684 / 11070) TaxID=281689 RepID=Q1K405_DESA6|nr:four helix bundle protein [Desulfuromonas acetoxidans]EAT17298.1 S23 ribosomal [Desulfuromonas acetoxidans DSM 684]MBF0646172.1 four helix bundle protein [Desulfuromonas acetoxidans]NVD26242.1 four helix bundle protein [Desulfuromonas acetoxidans]NVE15115.1 four helix bundle protein [Desulfuromonas acetoxidans]